MKRNIYLADLTHTAQGISAATFPLGISFVASYAAKELGENYALSVFKFPEKLETALRANPPAMLCLSNYSWNTELANALAALAKQERPELIVVGGGPNFPFEAWEQEAYLRQRPVIDFYIQLEGELGFVDLIRQLETYDFDAAALKCGRPQILNTLYLSDDEIVCGRTERILDVNAIPSPYLSGVLDEYFDQPLVPMLETTRGCPFSCTFCADGLAIKSRVKRFTDGRVQEELEYIASRTAKSDEMYITDLNFGMYKEDLVTCQQLAAIQEKYGWPLLIKAAAGKNQPERIIQSAATLNGSWVIGAAMQSSDPEVLGFIKRSNISSAAFQKFIDYNNSLGNDPQTYSEVILGLPGDTKEKHFESLNFAIRNGVNSLRMYQCILLMGTEMASRENRERFKLVTRFRTIPGCVGIYDFFGAPRSVAEVEEIIVGSESMPFEDYVACRVMNLLVETFYNNALFEEVFALLKTLGVPMFDCLVRIQDHPEDHPEPVAAILKEFVYQTSEDLFETRADAEAFILTPEIIKRYIGGELGINELLVSRARLVTQFDAIHELLFTAARVILLERGLLSAAVEGYLEELERFIACRKKNAITDSERRFRDQFNYDFKAITADNYHFDPNVMPKLKTPVEYEFFHDEEQQRHIGRQLGIYSSTPVGLGRLIQRSNMKLMYRRFESGDSTMAPHITGAGMTQHPPV